MNDKLFAWGFIGMSLWFLIGSKTNKKSNPGKDFLNCRLFVQNETGVSNVEAQPELSKPAYGAILWWGNKSGYRHMALYDGDGYVRQVEEWGAKPERKPLSEVEAYWGKPDRIYSSKFKSKYNPSKLSKSDIKKIKNLTSSGLSQIEIAKKLGVHYKTIKNVLDKHQWKKPKFVDTKNINRISTMTRQGLSYLEIARRLKMKPKTVLQYRSDYNIYALKLKPRVMSLQKKKLLKSIRSLTAKGLTAIEIARKLGKAPKTILEYRSRYKIYAINRNFGK